MRFLIFLSLFFVSVNLIGQAETINHRIVLKSDVGEIFEKNFSATDFGDSYFVCAHSYAVAFTDADFETFKLNCLNTSDKIQAFKSDDKKSIICIIPKPSIRGINSFNEFVNSNFPALYKSQIVNTKITHVEVVNNFDPLNLESEKGFNKLY